jgi:hypothetical protein
MSSIDEAFAKLLNDRETIIPPTVVSNTNTNTNKVQQSSLEPNDKCNGCRKEKGLDSTIRTSSFTCKNHMNN